jgi:peptidoglycan/xylan/chitin deacetylase (PgdA/CDA1 family)
MTVRTRDFEAQMSYLEKNGYHVIGLEQLYRYMLGTVRLPEKSVVITIDDGWRSFYRLGYPILKKHGFPATLFVYTELISGSSKTLDWGLVAEMARNGIDIQAHSKTHRNFNERYPGEPSDEYFRSLKTEIVGSAETIDARVGKKVRFFAYPYGEENTLAAALLEKNGFKAAFTVERKSAPFFTDRYRIGRRMIYGGFDLNAFKKNLEVYDDEALR